MLDHFTANNYGHFEDWRLRGAPGRVTVHRFMESDCTQAGCGWDEFTQSGKLTGCPLCGGTGKLVVESVTVLRARTVWGATNFAYATPAPGVQVGDVTLGLTAADVPLMEDVLQEQRAYLVVDGVTVRPTNLSPSILPGIGEGYLATCNLFTAETN